MMYIKCPDYYTFSKRIPDASGTGPALEATTPEPDFFCGDFSKLEISVPGRISGGFPDGGASKGLGQINYEMAQHEHVLMDF